MDNKKKVVKTKKKVVTTKQPANTVAPSSTNVKKKKAKTSSTTSRKTKSSVRTKNVPTELVFGRENYIFMGIGVGLIFIGMLLMLGGKMPTPEIWDETIIYSFRRTVLAPLVILAGLVVEIVAIFRGYKLPE